MPEYKSFANKKFWECYNDLPDNIQRLADKAYKVFRKNSQHSSLHFKKMGKKQPIYSVRITDNYRSLGLLQGNSMYWFWIGDHRSYEKLIKTI